MCRPMTRNCAPIALFVYARLDHAHQTVEALKRNPLAAESPLIVFSDAPKRPDVAAAVESVRRYVRALEGFKSIEIIERESNLGLAASIVGGVTSICESHGRVIVMEDDLVTSPYFLAYMNDALEKVRRNTPGGGGQQLPSTIQGAAAGNLFTMRRGMLGMGNVAARLGKIQSEQPGIAGGAQTQGHAKDVRPGRHLSLCPDARREQIAGRNDSWAIRWRASVVLEGMLSLYPRHALTRNIGFDGSGTHCGESSVWDHTLNSEAVHVTDIPLIHSEEAFRGFARFNRGLKRKNFMDKLVRALRGTR